MNRLSKIAVLGLSAVAFSAALAHGDQKPRHGGMVREVSELTFELVPQQGGAALYVQDHGTPVALAGITGTLTVLDGARKSQAELRVAGDRLEASGVELAKGAKVVVAVSTPQKKAITVRFTVR